MRNSIFFRYPIILLVLAAMVILNDLFKFAPGQVNTGFVGLIIPIVLIAAGVYGTMLNKKEKEDTLKKKGEQ